MRAASSPSDGAGTPIGDSPAIPPQRHYPEPMGIVGGARWVQDGGGWESSSKRGDLWRRAPSTRRSMSSPLGRRLRCSRSTSPSASQRSRRPTGEKPTSQHVGFSEGPPRACSPRFRSMFSRSRPSPRRLLDPKISAAGDSPDSPTPWRPRSSRSTSWPRMTLACTRCTRRSPSGRWLGGPWMERRLGMGSCSEGAAWSPWGSDSPTIFLRPVEWELMMFLMPQRLPGQRRGSPVGRRERCPIRPLSGAAENQLSSITERRDPICGPIQGDARDPETDGQTYVKPYVSGGGHHVSPWLRVAFLLPAVRVADLRERRFEQLERSQVQGEELVRAVRTPAP